MTNILAAIEITHRFREHAAALQDHVRTLRADFEASIADVVREASDAAHAQAESEENLRTLALSLYRANPKNRLVAPGVEVKLFTVTSYDPQQALEWAKTHGLCLALDKRAFDTLAKADSTRPEFVAIGKEPRAMLAADLGQALGIETGGH